MSNVWTEKRTPEEIPSRPEFRGSFEADARAIRDILKRSLGSFQQQQVTSTNAVLARPAARRGPACVTT